MKPEPGRIPVSPAQISDQETLISTGPHIGGRSSTLGHPGPFYLAATKSNPLTRASAIGR